MVKISGPLSVAVFKIKNKILYIFGCRHSDNKGLCRECIKQNDCMFITDFIDNLEYSDIFIESAWAAEESKDMVEKQSPISVLHTIRGKYYDNLYKHKQRRNVRFHYADIRYENTLWVMTKIVLDYSSNYFDSSKLDDMQQYLLKEFKDVKNLKKLADIVVKSNNYRESIKENFNKKTANKLLSCEFVPNASGKNNKGVHRVRKQLLKLTQKEQQQLLRYHKDMCKEIIYEYNKTNKAYFDIIIDGILPFLTHLMDMYLLGRMLYYIKDKETQNIVTYTGQTHAKHYVRFLTKYMKGTEEMYKENNENTKRIKRCVTLPSFV